jgi:hypothetical protein
MGSPLKLIAVGFVLLVLGALLPFLMLVGLVESTLFLNLVAAVCSIGGLTTGFMGLASYFRRDR